MTARLRCPKCQAEILRGYDSDTCGIPVTLDAHPVDNVGELLALTGGRRTFTVRASRDGRNVRRVFALRGPRQIAAPLQILAVHAEHRCDQPLPTAATPPVTDWPEVSF